MTGKRNSTPELRLWPGVAAVVVQCIVWLAIPVIWPEAAIVGVLGGVVGGLAVLVWWVFFSRAPMAERWGAVALAVVAAIAARPLLDPSIRGGMMGMLFVLYVIPALSVGLVAGAAAGRRLGPWPRRAAMALCLLAACGAFTLLRTDGITGEGRSQFAWRWTKTAEQQMLARTAAEPVKEEPQAPAPAPRPATQVRAEWPGFRGPRRDSTVRGIRVKTDWAASPPAQLWRREAGPGWSSFAAGGGLVYTQEQRGDFEAVACYHLATGKPVWTHRDPARFWESNGGAGPRGTPALHSGRVYSLGATGILNALDAVDGRVLWSRNAASDAGAKVPGWGFSGSPLVSVGTVIVAVGGRLAAYDAETGAPKWMGPKGGMSYSSPQLLDIGGVGHAVLVSDTGVTSVAPGDGKVLWQHAWPGSAILQPALAPDGGLLVATASAAGGIGTRRLAVARGAGGWTAGEMWTSNGLKPYFNDFVVHVGHAYGFDGSIMSCIDLQDGKRKWKGGRYGHGQLLLLADQAVLLVLSEEGEVALVSATPDQFREIARFRAMDDKTWNHPAIVRDLLLVRNGKEMVAYRLKRENGD